MYVCMYVCVWLQRLQQQLHEEQTSTAALRQENAELAKDLQELQLGTQSHDNELFRSEDKIRTLQEQLTKTVNCSVGLLQKRFVLTLTPLCCLIEMCRLLAAPTDRGVG